ncbi:MAG: hypothetical protein WCK89_24765 [bacterium]
MKKVLAGAVVALVLMGSVAPAFAEGKGGVMGLFVGCCFGTRAAGAYNDGKSVAMLEWLQLIGIGNIIAGIDGMGGKTTADLAKQYGAAYY